MHSRAYQFFRQFLPNKQLLKLRLTWTVGLATTYGVMSTINGEQVSSEWELKSANEWDSYFRKAADNAIYPESRLENIRKVHVNAIVNQAYQDLGGKKPLKISYEDIPGLTAASFPSFNSTNIIISNTNMVRLNSLMYFSDEEIYAIAGHESAHALRHHTFIQAASEGVIAVNLYLSFLLHFANKDFAQYAKKSQINSLRVGASATLRAGLFAGAYFFASKQVSKLTEIDADIYSVKKLGSANGLIRFFERKQINESQELKQDPIEAIDALKERVFAIHPSDKQRIAYLSMYATNQSELSKSVNYQQQRQEWKDEVKQNLF